MAVMIKKKALDAAIAKLEKDFGKRYSDEAGDPAARVAVETVPTGSLSLDIALGLGGACKRTSDRDIAFGVSGKDYSSTSYDFRGTEAGWYCRIY